MSENQKIEDRIRVIIESGGGQRDFTGEVMDEILYATGFTQKELGALVIAGIDVKSRQALCVALALGLVGKRKSQLAA